MFSKILIANRGEIACRVIRTARRLGIATVAVFSEADRAALHVESADEAIEIGPAPARKSYLDPAAIIAAARASGAEAIHPGYGFLSENAEFAESVAASGLVFIGPPATAIRAMGSKSAAKTLMAESGVALVPGYHGALQDEATLAQAAARVGYPVLIKASAGGGGKGMRIVARPEDLAVAIQGAKREARAAFGDDHVLIEKYLERPRHVEVQVFADTHGNCIHLFERDCSIQRRHQKIIEEAPAPGLDPGLRAAIGEAAIRAARAVGYLGAGTVEFIVANGAFHFMEMNTRLQVEHPVTEMITGLDLVEWQLRIAAGKRLPLGQEDITLTGHAIEARIYAEDPARDFLPATGRILHLRTPDPGPHVRIDTGVREGDRIGIEYDPMIAKLIVWDHDREAARRRLVGALAAYELAGVRTNLALLRAIAGHPDFAATAPDTGFIARHPELLASPTDAAPPEALAACALAVLRQREAVARAAAEASADPASPWAAVDGWRLFGRAAQEVLLREGETLHAITLHAPDEPGATPADWRITLPGGIFPVSGSWRGNRLRLRLAGHERALSVVADGETLTVLAAGATYHFRLFDPGATVGAESASGGRVLAPIPGYVGSVLVAPGEEVARGQRLIVLEAMKMEITLTAPFAGVVVSVSAESGAMVEEGRELAVVRPLA